MCLSFHIFVFGLKWKRSKLEVGSFKQWRCFKYLTEILPEQIVYDLGNLYRIFTKLQMNCLDFGFDPDSVKVTARSNV